MFTALLKKPNGELRSLSIFARDLAEAEACAKRMLNPGWKLVSVS